jgi:hypothetical protein
MPTLDAWAKALKSISPALLVRVILILGYLFVLGANLPGQLTVDSLIQLREGRSGIYASANPPAMSWLLGLFDRVIPGTGLYVTAVAALFFGSLIALTALRSRTTWLGVVAAAAIVLSPLTFIYQAIVWKDVLFADLAIAGFVACAYAAKRWSDPQGRKAPLIASVVLFSTAALVRQNGILALLSAAVALAIVATPSARPRTAAMYGLGFFAAGGAAMLLLSLTISVGHGENESRGLGIGIRILQHYDIYGTVHFAPDADLSLLGDPKVERSVREVASKYYSPKRVEFGAGTRFAAALWSVPSQTVNAQWRSLVFHDTGAYLRHKWAAFAWVAFTQDLPRCLAVHVGVSGLPEDVRALEMHNGFRPQDRMLYFYASHFFGTPVFAHAAYAIGALALLLLLLLRRDPQDIAIASLLVAGLAFAASFFFISVACDYRYLYFLDAATMTGFLYVAIDPPLREIKRLFSR